MLATQARGPDRRIGRQRAQDERIAVDVDAPELVEPRQVDHPRGRLTELARDPDDDVGAAGDRGDLILAGRAGKDRVRLGEGAGSLDRRLERHRHGQRPPAAIEIASMIFV